jgi:hypothetical protein
LSALLSISACGRSFKTLRAAGFVEAMVVRRGSVYTHRYSK